MNKKDLAAKRERVSQLLRDLRQEAGLRQVDVADTLGEPQSFVSKYESGERALEFVEIAEVCKAIGVTLRDFVALFEKAR